MRGSIIYKNFLIYKIVKYIKQFNESKTIDDLKNSPFLERSFIIDIFSDIIDCGYSLGFEGYYKHDWLFPGYFTVSSTPALNSFTAFTSEPTKMTTKITPKSGATSHYPAIYGTGILAF